MIVSVAQQKSPNEGTLNYYDFSSDKSKTFTLPKILSEISGLAISEDDRVFTHNDEVGTIYEIDIKSGNILGQFNVGSKKLKKDFEGIAIVEDYMFLVTSSGVLYKFRITDEAKDLEYLKIDTFLSAKYNVEGLCFDRFSNSLLLACKDYSGKNLKRFKAIYSFDLVSQMLLKEPRYLISLDSLKNKFRIKNFTPTGIEVHPLTGNIFILSSHDKVIVELSSIGEVLNAVKLKSDNHPQPEGITFLSNQSLLIADEGQNKKAKLTIVPLINGER